MYEFLSTLTAISQVVLLKLRMVEIGNGGDSWSYKYKTCKAPVT